jgi:hypothetical protein
LIFGRANDPIHATVDQANSLEPGYVDYGLRQPAAVNQPQPGYVDYGLRQPAAVNQPQPGYVDFGLRHPLTLTATTSASSADDYGVRCLMTGWCSVYPGNPQPSGMGTH